MRSLCLLGLAVLLGGCVAKIPFSPREDLVRTEGLEKSRKELSELMLRANRPVVGEVEISHDKLRYHHQVLTIFDIVAGTMWTQIYWQTLTRIDLYENNKIFLYAGQLEKGWLEFLSQGEAMRCANLIWSFRAHSLQPAPKPAPTPVKKKTEVIEKTTEETVEEKTVPK